jgi:hypothetical protein
MHDIGLSRVACRARLVGVRLAVFGLVSVAGCTEPTESGAACAAQPLSPLVPQRVTATAKKQTSQLVHVRTEHETLIVTPEHPFATPGSGWVPAGALSPGDVVVSARFGTVPVSAVHTETFPRSVPVFNLTVAPSHTYLVGANQVLVHNVNCNNLAERLAQREIGLRVPRSQMVRAYQTHLTRALERLNLAPDRPRATNAQRSLEILQRRLREERSSFQNAGHALAAELQRVGENTRSADEIRAEMVHLRDEWRTRLQNRLAQARRRQARPTSRDPVAEAAMAARESTLIERELNNPPF